MNNKVIVTYNGGGWYSFSPSGHSYYNNHDNVKVQGKHKCIKLLNDYNVIGLLDNKKKLN